MKTKRTPKKILRDAKGHFAHEDTCEGIYKDGSVTVLASVFQQGLSDGCNETNRNEVAIRQTAQS